MADAEEFYDREIAPALLSLAERCKGEGIDFVALADWKEGSGSTIMASEGCSHIVKWAAMAARCRGNVDALIMGLMRHGREVGHDSAALLILGIPTRPDGVADD